MNYSIQVAINCANHPYNMAVYISFLQLTTGEHMHARSTAVEALNFEPPIKPMT